MVLEGMPMSVQSWCWWPTVASSRSARTTMSSTSQAGFWLSSARFQNLLSGQKCEYSGPAP